VSYIQAFLNTKEWFGLTVLTALFAVVAYIAKSLQAWVQGILEARRRRRAELVRLQSLLRAAYVGFVIQRKHAAKLQKRIQGRITLAPIQSLDQSLDEDQTLDDIFATQYESLTANEKTLHTIIRAMTEHMLRPLNLSLLEWVRRDTYYGSQKGTRLAERLAWLEIHLLMWHAKYEVWIPGQPQHALVYLDDEDEHGIQFPRGLDDEVDKLVGWSPLDWSGPSTPEA
jgi:hypothetical protein